MHAQRTAVVQGPLATSFWEGAPDMDVLATPGLVSLLERTAAEAAAPLLGPGQVTVGVRVALEHLRAVAAGRTVEVRASVTERRDRSLSFELSAVADGETVARGTHTRAIVDRDRFLARLRGVR